MASAVQALFLLGLFSLLASPAAALDNGLGRTPAMGWNSWNYFGTHIADQLVRDQARALISTGLAKKGYIYVNLDDGWTDWSAGRTNGQFTPAGGFRPGMKALGDFIHSLGLKFGIYGDAGTKMCSMAAESGSHGREMTDAATFASWGVDYLKYDNCNLVGEDNLQTSQQRYATMRDALERSGRSIYFSICQWGKFSPAAWPGRSFGNSWRTVGDIKMSWESVMDNIDTNNEYAQYAGPGGWNDPDILQVGNGMTFSEDRAHFSLWALAKAPLLIGTDLTRMSSATLGILGNVDVIAVNQDPLGEQGRRKSRSGNTEVWAGRLQGGKFGDAWVVILLNRGGSTANVVATWQAIGIPSGRALYAKDLWKGSLLGQKSNSISAYVGSHDVAMFVLAADASRFTAGKSAVNRRRNPRRVRGGGMKRPVPVKGLVSTAVVEHGVRIILTSSWRKLPHGLSIRYTIQIEGARGRVCSATPKITNLAVPLGPPRCSSNVRTTPGLQVTRIRRFGTGNAYALYPGVLRFDARTCAYVAEGTFSGRAGPGIGNVQVAVRLRPRPRGAAWGRRGMKKSPSKYGRWVPLRGYKPTC